MLPFEPGLWQFFGQRQTSRLFIVLGEGGVRILLLFSTEIVGESYAFVFSRENCSMFFRRLFVIPRIFWAFSTLSFLVSKRHVSGNITHSSRNLFSVSFKFLGLSWDFGSFYWFVLHLHILEYHFKILNPFWLHGFVVKASVLPKRYGSGIRISINRSFPNNIMQYTLLEFPSVVYFRDVCMGRETNLLILLLRIFYFNMFFSNKLSRLSPGGYEGRILIQSSQGE